MQIRVSQEGGLFVSSEVLTLVCGFFLGSVFKGFSAFFACLLDTTILDSFFLFYLPNTTISSCHPLLLLPSIFPSIRVISNVSSLHIRWPKYWSFSFSITPFNEYSALISFRIDWFDLLALQGTLKESSPAPQFESINSSAQPSLESNSHIPTWLLEKP